MQDSYLREACRASIRRFQTYSPSHLTSAPSPPSSFIGHARSNVLIAPGNKFEQSGQPTLATSIMASTTSSLLQA